MTHLLRALAVFVLLLGTQQQALAESATPLPARKTEALEQLKSRLENEKAQQTALEQKMGAAEGELGTARQSLIKLGTSLQTSQKTLTDLQSRMATLEAERSALDEKIKADYGSMGDLILAMERIRRVPTETLVIRPGAPLETAQSAILLRSILPGIKARTDQMSADLNRMNTLRAALEADREKADQTAATLKAQEKDMQALLDKREKLYRQTRSAYAVQAESVARIAAEAQSLEQLVKTLKDSEDSARAAAAQKPARRQQAAARLPALPAGRWALPVQGTLVRRFGEADSIGAASEGIRISATRNALVTAPAPGIVRFAGPFRNYGNMIIIEHDKGLHSLIAGLSRIDTAVGQKISAGEPAGRLAGSGNDGGPTLYYELRHNGKPVDPSAKFPNLS